MRLRKSNYAVVLVASVCASVGVYCYGAQPTLVPAVGGTAISADTAGAAYTALTGPVYQEGNSGDIGQGTIVLDAPGGFVFDANSPVTVLLGGGTANHNLNNLTNGASIPATVATNSITISITAKSNNSTTNTLTWQNVRVRPVSSSPLASGRITNSGTATMAGVTTSTNFGTLNEVAGTTSRLVVSGFPATQTAGTAGSVTVVAQDQFGATASNYVGSVHFTSSDGQALLPVDYTFLASDFGTHFFSAGVTLKSAGSQSITATDVGTASLTGSQASIAVTPATADRLVFTTQPGSAIYGAPLSPQPVLRTRDPFGNSSTVGLGTSKTVSLTVSSGTGSLQGTTSLDIGTGAGNGTVTFSGIKATTAGAGKQLTASAAALANAVSSSFSVTQAVLVASITASNKAYDGTISASISSRTLSGVIAADDVILTGGTAVFADKNAGNSKPVLATGLALGGTSAGNYSLLTTATTNLANITPATLNGSADPKNRPYGQANPVFTASYTGFVNGETANIITGTLLGNTTAVTNSPVGAYPVSVSGQTAPNYTINYSPGILTITSISLLVRANDATRSYGMTNPPLTGSIVGMQNGDTITASYSTTAVPGSSVGTYPIVPTLNDPNARLGNYSVTTNLGTLTVQTTNHPPVLLALTNVIISPDSTFKATLYGSDPDGDQLTWSLDPNSPVTAGVTNVVKTQPLLSTNTVVRWTPGRAFASSTNFITVRVTDNGEPPMSATQSVMVIVQDFLDLNIGSTSVEGGQLATVPIGLASSDGVTNLTFTIAWPAASFTAPALNAQSSEIALATIQNLGNSLTLSIQTAPGLMLQNSNQIARLSFTVITNQPSAFIPLMPESVSATKPGGSAYDNYLPHGGTVAVVTDKPLLQAAVSTALGRNLLRFGHPGADYQLQFTTALQPPVLWQSLLTYTQTNIAMPLGLESTNPVIFYRLAQP